MYKIGFEYLDKDCGSWLFGPFFNDLFLDLRNDQAVDGRGREFFHLVFLSFFWLDYQSLSRNCVSLSLKWDSRAFKSPMEVLEALISLRKRSAEDLNLSRISFPVPETVAWSWKIVKLKASLSFVCNFFLLLLISLKLFHPRKTVLWNVPSTFILHKNNLIASIFILFHRHSAMN